MVDHCRYLALDLETSGLDPKEHCVLEIGAIAFDINPMRFYEFEVLINHKTIVGQPYALQMNKDLLWRIAHREGESESVAWSRLSRFIGDYCTDRPYPIGFNVGAFDMQWLPPWIKADINHRSIEMGSALLTNGVPMSSSEAVKRFLDKEVAHTALQDCRDTMEIFTREVLGVENV